MSYRRGGMGYLSKPSERYRPTVVETDSGEWSAVVFQGNDRMVWQSPTSYSTDTEAYVVARERANRFERTDE